VEGLNRSFYFDLTSYLPGDILVKVDRASMAHGLETRVPFLDRDLVEFLLSLPASLKVEAERAKIGLRRACEDLWPPAVKTRAKLGFGSPYDVWLELRDVREMRKRITEQNSRLRCLFPGLPTATHRLRAQQQWALLVLGLWLDTWKVSP
jgi:asparagine synthase (glutamine-hydrolysing)